MASNPPAFPPGSNVMQWPGPPPPGAVPPSCFSELARLNACYNEIQMMEAILSKVMVDLIQTDPAVIAAIQAELAKAGAGMPITGVTNGINAQPGIVGEFVTATASGTILAGTGPQNANIAPMTLQPGDWDVTALLHFPAVTSGGYFVPTFAGLNGDLIGNMSVTPPQTLDAMAIGSARAQVNISVPTLLTFLIVTWGGQATDYQFTVAARRSR